MAADIVGYSRLIESNEAATLATIKALRAEVIDPLLAEHKGRVAPGFIAMNQAWAHENSIPALQPFIARPVGRVAL
ncbi:hypothetical protein [Mesorhizobium sp.]|uniref:hypothetical protein n=1 Tax=Mesorhizobium sp. TaxID=1871066 RepID=UPI000FE7D593|nr:hypothetical protein [Mesorhizobium sp.]RWK38345.1 MAG: hypothetical protein EOR46_23965 [Mesorhizobium sp.]RWK67044.1 MAG: hypothetical protein EOR54_21155 [Mesorhizobium sp.]RWK74569.1 MAG: hypothetical protein EOR50_19630 [Mesorhizobium sp.]RWK83871.1 MAG: hypothetical protein EOR51_06705 [Mesorhizobium sp.]RWL00481.1 MAG: hypothetical protein EOR55_28760 [Mesorhizobium sp.]